jgi:hypothetical protein
MTFIFSQDALVDDPSQCFMNYINLFCLEENLAIPSTD